MTVIVMHDECNGWALKMRVRDWQAAARGQVNKREAHDERKSCSHEVDGLPNGSRLSCGRTGEKSNSPTCAVSFKRLLGGTDRDRVCHNPKRAG